MTTIDKIWLTSEAVHIRRADGVEAAERFEDYPRLKYATKKQRENFEVNVFGIHWPDIDEDLSFEGFFWKKERSPLYKLFIAHPELNASAIARRLGLAQSLLAQYISGAKRPSAKRVEMITAEIRKIGKELQCDSFCQK